ncbi:unnamed protein product [Blepharisma stoltei]|uniref:Uncharacterized protein n=1 Tax=Blepharisma stoltei TaxID=1481888 RepID=A0AAU9J4Z8_9CILI|nr:unnamed protein product [Blepharisma stoltei]
MGCTSSLGHAKVIRSTNQLKRADISSKKTRCTMKDLSFKMCRSTKTKEDLFAIGEVNPVMEESMRYNEFCVSECSKL